MVETTTEVGEGEESDKKSWKTLSGFCQLILSFPGLKPLTSGLCLAIRFSTGHFAMSQS